MKKETAMDKLTAGYEKFVQGKQISQNGKNAFNKAIKKAAKPKKQSGTK